MAQRTSGGAATCPGPAAENAPKAYQSTRAAKRRAPAPARKYRLLAPNGKNHPGFRPPDFPLGRDALQRGSSG